MKKILNRIYINYPIHFQSYEEIGNEYEFEFHNQTKQMIEQISVRSGRIDIDLDIHSDEATIKARIHKDSFVIDHFLVYIQHVTIDHKKYLTKDYEQVIIVPPQSVYSLRYERFLYQEKISEHIGRPRKEIKFIAEENPYYWNCVCGQHNMNGTDTCQSCGISKEALLSTKIDFQKEVKLTQNIVTTHKNLFIWLILMYATQIAYESLMGEFLFDNAIKNSFFGIFNRLILPAYLAFALIAVIRSRLKYKKKTTFLLISINTLIYAYLNLLSIFYFIGTSYNLIFLFTLNLGILGILAYSIKIKWNNIFIRGLAAFAVIASLIVIFEWGIYGKYDLTVQANGLYLNAETDEIDYTVPESIGGIKVAEVAFPFYREFDIENLTISRYIEKIYFRSAIVLDDLETVNVVPDNQNFYVEGNVLYNIDGSIRIVPTSIESIYIDDQVVLSGPFKDLINLKTITIGSHVKDIEAEAFMNAYSLETLIFEDESQLRFIGRRAFSNCLSLTSVEIPISVDKMGVGVFEGCTSIESLVMPYLGEEREYTDILFESQDVLTYQFGSKTYLDDFLIPESLKYVEIYDIDRIHNVTFFRAKHIEQIVLTGDFAYLGIRSFYGCESLEELIIPSGIETISLSAFENCLNLGYLVIPATVTKVERNAFLNAGLDVVIYLGDINDLEISPIGNSALLEALGLA
ncbi:MAG: leucine-rich repeat domain-containing protein [Acholeplasmataceae bacterium]|nr:leucine-rich repeat domain-containing protein [Acholeplasmataceae bacterium]